MPSFVGQAKKVGCPHERTFAAFPNPPLRHLSHRRDHRFILKQRSAALTYHPSLLDILQSA
jgi:hypothetical protein